MAKRFSLPPGWIKARTYHLLAPLVALLIVALFEQTWVGELLENQTISFRFKTRQAWDPKPDPRLVFLAIDESSLRYMGRFPWPREVWAGLLDTLQTGNDVPHTIAFDIMFTEDSVKNPGPASAANPDTILGNSIANYASLITGAQYIEPGNAGGSVVVADIERQTEEALKNTGSTASITHVLGDIRELKGSDLADFPVPAIRSQSLFGFVNDTPAADGIRHEVPLVVRVRDKVFPSLALQTLIQVLGVDTKDIYVDLPRHVVTMQDISKRWHTIPIEDDGQYYINYRKQENFNVVPISGVLQNLQLHMKGQEDLKPQWDLRQKAVLIGEDAVALTDLGPSPLEGRSPLPFVHLNVINNVLQNDYVRFIPWGFVVLGWSLVTWPTLLRLKDAPLLEAVSMPILVTLTYIAVAFGLFFWSIKITLAWPVLSYGVVNFWGVVLRWREEAKGRLQLKGIFAQMVSSEIMNHLLEHPENLKMGGSSRASTILFSDIRDFTKFSEGRTPNEVMDQLNVYFERMVACVLESKGTFHKFIGDAVMAAWGDIPDASQGPAVDAHNAVNSALLMRSRLRILNKEREAAGLTPIRIGIGLNHGVVQAGMLGSQARKEFTMIGDEVNVASRLEGITKEFHTDVAISESVRRLLGNGFLVRRLGFIQLKGKTKPTLVFEVLSEKTNLADARMAPEGVERYETAFDLLLARRFAEAEKAFAACLKEYPDDYCVTQYLAASREFSQNPPPPDWDGRIVMTTK